MSGDLVNRKSVDLPNDLVIEILSLLPTKSLRRFMCVSKLWANFIYYLYSEKRIGILLPMSALFIDRQLYYPDHEIYLPLTHHSHDHIWRSFFSRMCWKYDLHVIHSCNGLLLLTSNYGAVSKYYVCNFATMEYVQIDTNNTNCCIFGSGNDFPAPYPVRPPEVYQSYVGCFLAFDPRRSPHYKVVHFSLKATTNILVQIYSSLTTSWFELIVPQEHPLRLDNWDDMAVFHKGALHILTYGDHLVRFQIDDESFHLIKLPHTFSSEYGPPTRECRLGWIRVVSCIGESRGQLYYATNTCCQLEELRIYMLEEHDTKQWRLMHKITTSELSSQCYFSYFQPIAIHPDSEVIYLGTTHGIFSYDPCKSRLEKLCSFVDHDVVEDVYWTAVFPVIYCLEFLW